MEEMTSRSQAVRGAAPGERMPAEGTRHDPARRLPIGVEPVAGGVHARVWAPACRRVEIVVAGDRQRACVLEPEGGGYFSGRPAGAAAGELYGFRLDGDDDLIPDPASRFQPQGPLGLSRIVDASTFAWTDHAWRGIDGPGQVIYEMHIGTFTPEGTWRAAERHLRDLAELGVTILEVMPVADFAGNFGWGYDGVDLFAPTRLYGEPDDFRHFVDGAHAQGLGVVLDVVYNHLGPVGNVLKRFSEDYFSRRYATDWGEALNFDGPNSGPVRELVTANAAYWIAEFHLDGLRLDATQSIFDDEDGHEHILADIVRSARKAAGERPVFILAENEPQDVRLLRPLEQGGFGMQAMWNDDFHHAATVALTSRSEAYYTDYRGRPQEFVSAAKHGFLYQGQWYKWQKKPRGTRTAGREPADFVTFIQNHDQIANSARGQRVHRLTSPGRLRAVTALLLLGPGTPMLFQGQEFAASSPFLYFAGFDGELADLVHRGRVEFLSQFASIATPETREQLPRPNDPMTFVRSKLDHSEKDRHAEAYALHRELLRLRREDPVFSLQRRGGVDGAVLTEEALVLRFFGANGLDRLLLVNLGPDLHLDPAPEPLLAPELGGGWQVLWSSEDPRYGGLGTPPVYTEAGWRLPGECALALSPSASGPTPEA